MKLAKTFVYNDNQNLETNVRRLNQDASQIFTALQGRIRFGTGADGARGENIAGEFQVIADTGTANTEFTVAHTIGALPIGYIVVKQSNAGVIYLGTTSWTSSNVYLKSSAANSAITIFLLK